MTTITLETETPSGRYRGRAKGLPLRDIFAGLAMQGILANSAAEHVNPEIIAEDAYIHADAMLKVRARKEQP